MAHCVNRTSPEFIALAEQSNINPIILAAKVSLWQEKNGLDNFPTIEDVYSSVEVNLSLKAVDILASQKAIDTFAKGQKNNWPIEKTLTELQIPGEQKQLILASGKTNLDDIITDLLANYSYAIEINIAKEKDISQFNQEYNEHTRVFKYNGFEYRADDYYAEESGIIYEKAPLNNLNNTVSITEQEFNQAANNAGFNKTQPTQYYSNLTVPGGTNYTENEIATPAIKPSIKGHGQFSTDNGIGWFRSDEQEIADVNYSKLEFADGKWGIYDNSRTFMFKTFKTEQEGKAYLDENRDQEAFTTNKQITKTRRILEVQSDLFQKGRQRFDLTSYDLKVGDTFETDKGLIEVTDILEGSQTINIKNLTTGVSQYLDRDTFITAYKNKIGKSPVSKNEFLQLLNKDNNWVTFFVKSILQDSAKKGYEKVLFPRLDTIIQIESSGKWKTYEEAEKAMKDDRWQEIDQEYRQVLREQQEEYSKNPTEKLKQLIVESKERIASHQPSLLNTARFYENDLTNVLKKQGYAPKQVTDEYGNTWNEVEIVPIRERKSILLQTKEMPGSKVSKETLEVLKAAAQKMGIDFQSLEEYAKANPDINVKGVTGLADLIKGTIAVAQGMENVATTEEIVHMATAILEQTNPKLITQLISKIDRFKIYKQVLATYSKRKEYQLSNGKPDIRKIKKEAVDKLIAELIVKQSEGSTEFPELMEENTRSMIQEWWNTILDYLRGVYGKSNIDIFETAAQQILTGEVDGTVADIKQGGIFFNLSDDVKKQIDDLYDKYIETDADLELNPETPTDKRHYTYRDVKVAKTVTEKVKEKFNKIFERTPAQKIEDDQKKEWGSEGHRFLEQHFLTNLIDKDGYKRKVAGTASISSTLSPEIQIQLRKFAKELVDSYPDGTRFLIEKKVVNTKVKGMLASTVDFKAIYPVTKRDGTQGLKVDTLDWKFTSINKTTEEDIPWFKQKEWVPQMGEYTQIDYNFGVKKDQIGKARMIPFIMNYDYALVNNRKSGLVPTGIEIGKLDSLTETNLYLLPVPTVAESTGNSGVDALVKSLREHWEKLSKVKITSIEQKIAREEQLNELSKAIRNLHIKLNFAPLQSVGETFLKTAKKSIDSFENIDYSTLSKDEVEQKLADLLEYAKSAEKFTNLDQVFLSEYPREGMTADNKKILLELEHLSKSTERMLKKILQLQTEYAIQLGVKEGFDMPYSEDELGNKKLQAEAEISGWAKTWAEGTKLNARIIKLASNLLMNAKSLVNIKFKQSYTQFQELLAPLEEEARKQNKSAFDFIGKITPEGLKLINKIDPKFWAQLKEASEKRDVDFFLRNININEYNRLAKEAIDKGLEVINDTTYSADEEEDARIKEFRASKLKDSLDINRDSFNGFNRYEFKKLVNQTLQEDKLYSNEFKELVKNKAAYDMWQYFTALNNKAKSLGYIQEKETSFFPLIEATTIQKFSKTKNFLNQAGESFWKDLYQTRINEEQNLSKLDPETGKVRKEVPKYFTKTDKDVSQLSTDLNKVGALWIKSLLEYEKSTSMESTMQTLLAVERAKGSLMKDQEGRVIFDEDGPKVNEAENRNAIVLETIIDDSLYNLNEDLGSIGNIGIGKVSEKLGKTEEAKAKKAVNIKKGLKNLDTLTRALAVGLKPLIAVANWAGGQFQSYINAGGMYRFREFEKNNAKIMMPLGKGLSIVERGLLDLIVPLNDDITTEEARNAAWEKGQYVKWLGTWTFSDAMMSSNSFPEKKLQFANAMSFNDNSMVVDGKIVNIRQFLKAQDRKSKYDLSESERKELEKTFEDRVKELQESSSLAKIAKVENDRTVIPGVSDEELAKYRTKVVEYGRKLNGQMNEDNKAGYRRDTIISSFMMFKTWIPKMVSERGMDITKNVELDEWEYGRVRLFFKTWNQLGARNILKMREIINGTDEGLRILDEMLEAKKEDYYKKTGQVLEITSEEFYDLVRKELTNEMKELRLLLILGAMLFLAGAAKPPEEADDQTKNIYKGLAKGLHKISDEVMFYYDPRSFEGMTKGSILPSLNIITKAMRIFDAVGKEMEDPEKGHPMKYVFGLIPGLSQFQTEILPYINPELAKEMGIRVSAEARRQ